METTSSAGITKRDMYEQGSKACIHYSERTMQVRTLAQQVLITFGVGMGIFWGQLGQTDPTRKLFAPALIAAGMVLGVFAYVLSVLNRHHSTAFRVIRDRSLVHLEQEIIAKPATEDKTSRTGPWTAHQILRDGQQKKLFNAPWAWDVPFVALGIIAALSVFAGFVMLWTSGNP